MVGGLDRSSPGVEHPGWAGSHLQVTAGWRYGLYWWRVESLALVMGRVSTVLVGLFGAGLKVRGISPQAFRPHNRGPRGNRDG